MSDELVDGCTQEQNKCINEIVKAILILDYTKKPFKQHEIWKFLSTKPSRKHWGEIFETVNVKLQEMGYSLVKVKSQENKAFMLTSRLFPTPNMYKLADERERANRTLLVLVLALIFMKEAPVNVVDLFSHLEELKICSLENPVHEYFGDVKKKILHEFTSQLYLEKIIDNETNNIDLTWGERAHAEVSKFLILNFVCKIGYEGKLKPKDFASHYHTVLEEGIEDNVEES